MKDSLLGIKLNNINLETGFSELFNMTKQTQIVKLNSEFLTRSLNNNDFYKIISDSNIIVDGVGVQWALKYLSLPVSRNRFLRTVQAIWQMVYTGASLVFYPKYCASICERIPGLDAFNLMMSASEMNGIRVYILGGEQRVLDTAVEKIKVQFPKLKLVGFMEGWHFKDEEAIKEINDSKAELLIVALGSPRQEFWIRDNLKKLKTVKVAVGEGGTLDFVAGTFIRAPKWMQKLGIEWLWRLFMNRSKTQTGSRLRRVWNAVPLFIFQIVKYKIRGNNNEKQS